MRLRLMLAFPEQRELAGVARRVLGPVVSAIIRATSDRGRRVDARAPRWVERANHSSERLVGCAADRPLCMPAARGPSLRPYSVLTGMTYAASDPSSAAARFGECIQAMIFHVLTSPAALTPLRSKWILRISIAALRGDYGCPNGLAPMPLRTCEMTTLAYPATVPDPIDPRLRAASCIADSMGLGLFICDTISGLGGS